MAAMLCGKHGLVYQHGELAVPQEACVPGDYGVAVPDASAADAFRRVGVAHSRIIVSGLCVEPSLADQSPAAFDARIARLERGGPLTGAFFSSGAEPRVHVENLVASSLAAVCAGGRALLFAKAGGVFRARAIRAYARAGVELGTAYAGEDRTGKAAMLFLYRDRKELNAMTTGAFAGFDYFMAPSHERCNWALGLGLPMFIAEPAIGTFSPLNRERVLAEGTAQSAALADAATFGERLRRLQAEGALVRMAGSGWGRYSLDGFRRIATRLEEGWPMIESVTSRNRASAMPA